MKISNFYCLKYPSSNTKSCHLCVCICCRRRQPSTITIQITRFRFLHHSRPTLICWPLIRSLRFPCACCACVRTDTLMTSVMIVDNGDVLPALRPFSPPHADSFPHHNTQLAQLINQFVCVCVCDFYIVRFTWRQSWILCISANDRIVFFLLFVLN